MSQPNKLSKIMWIKTTQLYIPILELDLDNTSSPLTESSFMSMSILLPVQMVVLLALLVLQMYLPYFSLAFIHILGIVSKLTIRALIVEEDKTRDAKGCTYYAKKNRVKKPPSIDYR
jgi:hypothetical protein